FCRCAERRARHRRLRGSVRNRLRTQSTCGGGQAQRQKSFAQAGKKESVHHRLDALVYYARWMKTDAKMIRWTWNVTTTNRRGTKRSTICRVFPLTRIGQELILRIADFGERGSARAGFSASGE